MANIYIRFFLCTKIASSGFSKINFFFIIKFQILNRWKISQYFMDFDIIFILLFGIKLNVFLYINFYHIYVRDTRIDCRKVKSSESRHLKLFVILRKFQWDLFLRFTEVGGWQICLSKEFEFVNFGAKVFFRFEERNFLQRN